MTVNKVAELCDLHSSAIYSSPKNCTGLMVRVKCTENSYRRSKDQLTCVNRTSVIDVYSVFSASPLAYFIVDWV